MGCGSSRGEAYRGHGPVQRDLSEADVIEKLECNASGETKELLPSDIRPLSQFFQGNYLQGHCFVNSTEYQRDRCDEANTDIIKHRESGICSWADLVDLTSYGQFPAIQFDYWI